MAVAVGSGSASLEYHQLEQAVAYLVRSSKGKELLLNVQSLKIVCPSNNFPLFLQDKEAKEMNSRLAV